MLGGMVDETIEQSADRAAAARDFAGAREMLERAVEVDGSNFALWMKLSAMRKVSGDVRGALGAVERALTIAPLEFSALLARAMFLDSLGDPMAGEEFGNALAQAPPDDQLADPMRPGVEHARKRWQMHQMALEQRLIELLPVDLSAIERTRAERLISNRTRRTRHFHQEPRDYHYPGLPEVEFHDRELFPQLGILERATAEICAEFEALIAAEAAEMVPYVQYPERVPLRQWRELNHNPDWSAIHLLQNGYRIDRNARHCPATLEAVARMPQPHVRNASPNAMFSLLAPRTRIPPHTGVANTRLVCHLPLIVPPNCGFRVGETTREWRVGEAFVFDDTIEHEAWNESDELRVVLIIDLWAPALGATERAAVAAVIGAAGSTAGI